MERVRELRHFFYEARSSVTDTLLSPWVADLDKVDRAVVAARSLAANPAFR